MKSLTRFGLPLLTLAVQVSVWTPSAYSEIRLQKLRGWSATSVDSVIDFETYRSVSDLLVASASNEQIRVFSVQAAGLIFEKSFHSDTAVIWGIALGDFDADTNIELASIVWEPSMPDTFGELIGAPTQTATFRIVAWDLADTTRIDTITYAIEAEWAFQYLRWAGGNNKYYPSLLRATPGENDKDTLIASLSWIRSGLKYGFWWGFESFGITEKWSSFPDVKVDSTTQPTTSFNRPNQTTSSWSSYKWTFQEISGPDRYDYQSRAFIQKAGESPEVVPIQSLNALDLSCSDSPYFQDQWHVEIHQRPVVFGDIDTTNSGLEALFYQSNTTVCERLRYYQLFNIESPQLDSLWILPASSYAQFVYHPTRPGRFMARDTSKIFEFDGLTGATIDSTIDTLPRNVLGWYDIFGDGNKYLISQSSAQLTAWTFDIVTDAEDEPQSALPVTFTLSKPAPNPFNPTTGFTLSSPAKSDVTIAVYNLLGQKVDEVFSGNVSAGEYHFEWRADDFASGLYFVRAVNGDGYTVTRKALLLK